MDKFTQFAAITCSESAANTLTFQKLETGYNRNAKIGWVIQQVQWYFNIAAADFLDEADYLSMALTGNNTLTSLTDLSNPAVYAFKVAAKTEFTDVGFAVIEKPFVSDFSNLLGGGILVAPSPLYLAVKGGGLVNAQAVKVRIAFFEVDLKPEEFVELYQSTQIIS